MTLYRRSDRLDELDRWFDITLRCQFMVGFSTYADPISKKPYRGWTFCLGPIAVMWSYPIQKKTDTAKIGT